ncbi:hypothetical protein ZIOFF_000547 [Zingiber officinale]|uniref:HTH OST-type domain-containing protein n=1 Tax=Zingiber officinale TaxID=94328 RepID=A0A8J5I8C5_ZINOF|nr:hypothetical protein ZIOFF_000547 [Zingiber officinale]
MNFCKLKSVILNYGIIVCFREQLVHGLQKGGPWVLKDLSKAQLFELVNLMIVEKKWIEESILQMFPFRLNLAKQKCATSHCYNSNGLSSLFTGKISKSSIHRQPEQETYGHKSGSLGSSFAVTNSVNQPQNVLEFKSWFQKTYTRKEDVQPEDLEKMFESMFSIKLVPSSYGYPDLQSLIEVCANDDNYENKKIKSSPSGEKILFDCRKLLVELFDEYPDGFDMSIFKPAFLQRHGYVLESETLGYPNLASLLEIMPRVRMESSFVIPTERFRSNSSSTNQLTIGTLDLTSLDNKGNAGINTSQESASEDCAWEEWEELGGVHETIVREDLTAAPIQDREVTYDDSLSEDELSDSEGTPPLQDVVEKSQRCGEESSLIQILDSWYDSKEGGLKKSSKDGCGVEQAVVPDGLVDCATNKPEILVDIKPKLRSHKRYNFVSNSEDKEKLVDSILGSLKKAGNSKFYS